MKASLSYSIILIILLLPAFVEAQESSSSQPLNFSKGSFFFTWGWNQAQYANSDIHFTGPNYDFTLRDVVATDRPTHLKPEIYFNPSTITIPQTNFRLGYFLSDKWSVILGYDHMKYVVTQFQTVDIDGEISIGNPELDGSYDGDPIELDYDFLKYEHTDGLNYIFLGANYNHTLLSLPEHGISTGNMSLDGFAGADAGIVLPKTNAILMGMEQSDRFHLAGIGTGLNVGLTYSFFKYFFIGAQFKAGYIYMYDVKTTLHQEDKATQNIWFIQENFCLGFKTQF